MLSTFSNSLLSHILSTCHHSPTWLLLQFRIGGCQEDELPCRRPMSEVSREGDFLKLYLNLESSRNKKETGRKLACLCKERPQQRGSPRMGHPQLHQGCIHRVLMQQNEAYTTIVGVGLECFSSSRALRRTILISRTSLYVFIE